MAVSDRVPKSPTSKPIRTTSSSSTSRANISKPPPPSLASSFAQHHNYQQQPLTAISAAASVHSRSTTASTKSTLTRRRLAFSKELTADKQLYIPRAELWSHGCTVQSVQTGNPLFAINHFATLATTRDRPWQGNGITEAIISEVDPATKKVGKILALVRREGIKYVVYTYFRAYQGQPVSFVDNRDFYQGNMFRHGEMANSKKRCAYAMACDLAEYYGLDIVRPVWEAAAAPSSVIPSRRNKEWMLDLRDVKSKEAKIWRQVDVEAVTIRAGLNMLVATSLVYVAETIMNA